MQRRYKLNPLNGCIAYIIIITCAHNIHVHNYSYIRYLENMHYGFSALHRCVQQPTYLD